MTCPLLAERRAGVLLHPTSLSGPLTSGDIGPEARKFVDYLAEAKMSFWQMLPIHPIGGGESPYDSPSAFAGAPHLISLEELVADGLLSPAEFDAACADLPKTPPRTRRANLSHGLAVRSNFLRRAYERFGATGLLRNEYEAYLSRESSWVYDFALFMSLKKRLGSNTWLEFPAELRLRQRSALDQAHRDHQAEIGYHLFEQFCFDRQWEKLRQYALANGVYLMGDIPMFVAHDSADVWANQHMFFLNERGERTVQAGVPPDYFTEDGQLWGNPLYRWDVMREDGFGWWVDRLRRELHRFDVVRLDHFIAFCRYWEVPVPAQTAKTGRYIGVPGYEFFHTVRDRLGSLPFVAEDLGILTEEVSAMRDRLELPGMRILQFAFSPGAESYLPHRHPRNSVVYTGTHDNDTTVGFVSATVESARTGHALKLAELERLEAWAGSREPKEATRALIRTLFGSQANTAVVPMQDILELDNDNRMNIPGTPEGNWTFRMAPDDLEKGRSGELAALIRATERAHTRLG
jgi:4-alpha-glucanotransferase